MTRRFIRRRRTAEPPEQRGSELPAETRASFEQRLGHDFAKVRVHTDSEADGSARAAGALAYTIGTDIVFRSGEYDPASDEGRRLLAHELTHVVQQSGSPPTVQAAPETAATEKEAAPAVDADIEALDLEATAKAGAQALREKHPEVVFRSGRRGLAEQARVMARNIVEGGRTWISATYSKTSASDRLQKWVDDHREATTENDLAAGLQAELEGLSAKQQTWISKHLTGEAFDVQPQEKDADQIKTDMAALAGATKFLPKEGGLDRWHVQFQLAGAPAAADEREREARKAADDVSASAPNARKDASGAPARADRLSSAAAATPNDESHVAFLAQVLADADEAGWSAVTITVTRTESGLETPSFRKHEPSGQRPASRAAISPPSAARRLVGPALSALTVSAPGIYVITVQRTEPGGWFELSSVRRVADLPKPPPGPPPARSVTADEHGVLERLARLGALARSEGTSGTEFAASVDGLRTALEARVAALREGEPLPRDVDLVMKALILWSEDPGNRWGEGSWDSDDLVLSAPDYVTVPEAQYKCNAYVAEVSYRSLGVVFRAHEHHEQKGKFFPYRAADWHDTSIAIPQFKVVSDPQLGDIWSTGTHVGIYLGEYSGKRVYVSARDDGRGVFALGELQQKHGIQIKFQGEGGVYRRYTP